MPLTGCQSLEQFQVTNNIPPIAHSPDDLVSLGIDIDVSDDWAKGMPSDLNRDNWRMMDAGGQHGLQFLVNNLLLCRLFAASAAGDEAAAAAVGPDAFAKNHVPQAAIPHHDPGAVPACPKPFHITERDGCQ
jgi:hypothetical protein